MKHAVVISVSVGTALLLFGLTAIIAIGIVVASISVHNQPKTPVDVFRPKAGAVGEIERQINDLKYGPVNMDAAKEVKNGLFSRIRQNRQSRICQPQQQACQVQQASSPVVVVERSDCNYGYVATSPAVVIANQPAPIVNAVEMPAVSPINPLAIEDETPDSTCIPCNRRAELKTGAFICTNCRKSQVGEWHTEWNGDGTPVTFLCESCFQKMSEAQRAKAYAAYKSRQLTKQGVAGLLHQELGN